MIITMKLRKPKGMGKREIHERIALQVNKQFHKKQLKGLIGEKHPISKGNIQFWIEDYCLKKKYLHSVDKLQRDYWLFLERLYKTIMTNYIRKDELTKDTDDKYNLNEYYYPGLVYITGVGYIITNSQELIKKYEEQRTYCLDSQKLHLNQKCQDADEFVKQLPEHQKGLLDDGKDREIT